MNGRWELKGRVVDDGLWGALQLRGALVTERDVTTAAMALSRTVREVLVETGEPGCATVTVRLAWWTWLALGLKHRRVRLELYRLLRDFGPAHVHWTINVR